MGSPFPGFWGRQSPIAPAGPGGLCSGSCFPDHLEGGGQSQLCVLGDAAGIFRSIRHCLQAGALGRRSGKGKEGGRVMAGSQIETVNASLAQGRVSGAGDALSQPRSS